MKGTWITAGVVSAALALAGPVAGSAAAGEHPDQACLLRAATGELRCYPSAAALLEAVTGSAAGGATTADLADPATVASIEQGLARERRSEAGLRAARTTSGSVVTAVFYDGTFGHGAALVMEAPTGCDDDTGVEWAWPTLTPGWRNRIRSGVGYARCEFKVWNHASYAGAAYGYVASSGHLGALNGAANSVKMR